MLIRYNNTCNFIKKKTKKLLVQYLNQIINVCSMYELFFIDCNANRNFVVLTLELK